MRRVSPVSASAVRRGRFRETRVRGGRERYGDEIVAARRDAERLDKGRGHEIGNEKDRPPCDAGPD